MKAYITWVLNSHEYVMTFNKDSLFTSLKNWIESNKNSIKSYSIDCDNANRRQDIEEYIESILNVEVLAGEILEVLSWDDNEKITTLKNHFYINDRSICGSIDLNHRRYDVIGIGSYIECKVCAKKSRK